MPEETIADDLEPRKGSPSPRLSEEEFKRRFRNQFQDDANGPLKEELGKIAAAASGAYEHSRKSSHTGKAGRAFEDPDYDLATDC